jgi:CRP-like cAMP-binding protein
MPPLHAEQYQKNGLLAALPLAELSLLDAQLEYVALQPRQDLFIPDEPVSAVYFPLSGLVSLVAYGDYKGEQTPAKVAVIGREGMVGFPFVPADTHLPLRSVCPVPGAAYRLAAAVLNERKEELPVLRGLLWQHSVCLLSQVAHTATCNLFHPIAQRCARWLLAVHDNVGADDFAVTHEFLAEMLGTRRGTVTAALRTFAKAGLIEYRWGQMTILDRVGLEAAGCRCYQRIKSEYARLLPRS